jgi:hypothetical protein
VGLACGGERRDTADVAATSVWNAMPRSIHRGEVELRDRTRYWRLKVSGLPLVGDGERIMAGETVSKVRGTAYRLCTQVVCFFVLALVMLEYMIKKLAKKR